MYVTMMPSVTWIIRREPDDDISAPGYGNHVLDGRVHVVHPGDVPASPVRVAPRGSQASLVTTQYVLVDPHNIGVGVVVGVSYFHHVKGMAMKMDRMLPLQKSCVWYVTILLIMIVTPLFSI